MAGRKKKAELLQEQEKKSYSKQEIITLMHEQTLMIISEVAKERRVMTMREADMIAKLCVSIERLEDKASIETIMNVLMEFTKFLCLKDIEFAKKHNQYQNEYIKAIIDANK
jgi:hypothetical protein